MNIFFEDSMPYGFEFLSELGQCQEFSHQSITPEDLSNADVLLVRSTTKVNHTLLQYAKKLKFIGTATAGTDHVDKQLLAESEIPFVSAAGCNAIAVAEYVISALFVMAERLQWDLSFKEVGIVGAGNVGTVLAAKLDALKIRYQLCDPILAEAGDERSFVSLERIMQCDVISLHTSLHQNKKYSSYHMFDEKRLAMLNDEQVLINACRGEVVDNKAALKLFQHGRKLNLVLDVWENEPNILLELVPHVALATAHIAGHTIEGKARGTEMLYNALCSMLQKPVNLSLEKLLPSPQQSVLLLNRKKDPINSIKSLILSVYDIRNDDKLFKATVSRPGQFSYIRKHYAVRREFAAFQVQSPEENIIKMAYGLGFKPS